MKNKSQSFYFLTFCFSGPSPWLLLVLFSVTMVEKWMPMAAPARA